MGSTDALLLSKLLPKIKDRTYKYWINERKEHILNGVYDQPPKPIELIKKGFESIYGLTRLREEYTRLCERHFYKDYLEVYSKDMRPFMKSTYPEFKLISSDRCITQTYYPQNVPITLTIYFRGLIEAILSTKGANFRFRTFMPPYAECIKRHVYPAPTKVDLDEMNLIIKIIIRMSLNMIDHLNLQFQKP